MQENDVIDDMITKIINEIKSEQTTSPFFDVSVLTNYAKEGIFKINEVAGIEIDYEIDLSARSLLKNYVLYANHKMLAEYNSLYGGEILGLQAKYSKDSSVS